MRNFFINSVKRVFAVFVIMCAFITVNAQSVEKQKKWDFALSASYDISNMCSAKIMEGVTLGYNIGKLTTVSLDALMTFSDNDSDTWGMFATAGVHPTIAKNLEVAPYIGIGVMDGLVDGMGSDTHLAGELGVSAKYSFYKNVYCGISAKGICAGKHKTGAFAGVSLGYTF